MSGVYRGPGGTGDGKSDSSIGSVDLARRWAEEDEDIVVADSEYSAKHYAAKAKAAVGSIITVSATEPESPEENDLWLDIS